MISEVANALFLTFVATEYLLSDTTTYNNRRHYVATTPIAGTSWIEQVRNLLRQRRSMIIATIVLLFIHGLEHVTGMTEWVQATFSRFLHLPRVIFAATAYVGLLYWDCRRCCSYLRYNTNNGTTPYFSWWRDFLPQVIAAFVRILPLYPFLAVLISFGFLFVINLFEFFDWPLELLNGPIYYGVLYGPFSYVYFSVKRRILADQDVLPTTTTSTLNGK